MAGMDQILEEASAIQQERALGQTSLFAAFDEEPVDASGGSTWSKPLPQVKEWSQDQLLQYERQLTGFYITAHPFAQHAEAMRLLSTHHTGTLHEAPEGKDVKLCGVIGNIKGTTTKKGDRMAYLQIEDLQGLVEVIVFPQLFKECEPFIVADAVIHITGTVDKMDTGARIKATKLEPLNELQAKSVKRVTLRLKEHEDTWGNLPHLQEVLLKHPGAAPISFQFQLNSNVEADSTPIPDLMVMPSEHLVNDVEQILGKESVIFHHA